MTGFGAEGSPPEDRELAMAVAAYTLTFKQPGLAAARRAADEPDEERSAAELMRAWYRGQWTPVFR